MRPSRLFIALAIGLGLTMSLLSIIGRRATLAASAKQLGPVAELSISKRASNYEIAAAEQVTYTLLVTNAGPNTVDAVITDTLIPLEAVGNVSAPPGCNGSGPLVCSLSGLTGTQTLTIVVTTYPTFTGILTNSAVISTTADSLAEDPDSNNNGTGPVVVNVQQYADLAIEKEVLGQAIVAGRQIAYTLTMTNPGPGTVDAEVEDVLWPHNAVSGVKFSSGCNWNGLPPVEISCNIPNLVGTRMLTVVVTTNPNFSGPLDNSSNVSLAELSSARDPDLGNNYSGDIRVYILQPADLAISKLPSSHTITAGQRITYTLTATNAGPTTVDAIVTDAFSPSVASYLTLVPPACTGSAPLVCNLTDMIDNQALAIVATTYPTFTGILTNRAVIAPTGLVTDTHLQDNDTGPVPVFVQQYADLSVSKVASTNRMTASQQVVYTLTVTNPTSAPVDASVTDTISPGDAGHFVSGSTGCYFIDQEANCTLPALVGTRTLTLVVTTYPTFTGQMVNDAIVGPVSESLVKDPDPNNNRAKTVTVYVQQYADLSLTKTASSRDVVAGQQVTYTLIAINPSLGSVRARVIDTLWPGEAIAGRDIIASPGCNVAFPSVSCDLPELVGTHFLTVTVTTHPDFSGILNNSASITTIGLSQDPDLRNNFTGYVPVRALRPADLSITKEASSNIITAGLPITYTLIVTNSSSAPVYAIVTDTLSPANALGFASSPDCDWNLSDSVASCNLPGLIGARTLTLVITTNLTFEGDLTNRAIIMPSGFATDTLLNNNSDMASITILPNPDILSLYLPVIFKSYCPQAPYYEENDNWDCAFGPLEPGESYKAYPDDLDDYFFIVLTNFATVGVDVTNYQAEGQLLLYDEGRERKGHDGGGGPTLRIGPITLPPGKYYIRVYTSSGYNTNHLYTLKVSY
jgi:uncharacterized repeat protein (TIGR01451 family)